MNREDYKRRLRTMKDGKAIALDTMTGPELVSAAELCMLSEVGDDRYKERALGIVRDFNNERNLYITLPMRRALMGYIRPVFVEEWNKRNKKQSEHRLHVNKAIQGQGRRNING